MTSLRKHQKWENLSWKPTPFCSLKPALSWVRFCCNFTKKMPNRIGEVKSIYLKTSLPATWTASKAQKCQPTWSNIGKTEACCWTLGKWIPSSGEMRNIEKPLHSYDIYFGHEKTCCCDIILVLMEWFAHCMPSAQVIQEDLLYRTWNTKTIKTSPTVHCSTWTCSSMSISPAQTDWR